MNRPQVVYEDNHLIVAIKPFGMPSQEDETKDPDMLSWVKGYVKEKYQKPGEVYIGLLHRLDRVAGGLMVFARTSKAASRMSEEIRNRSFQKGYHTIIEGKMEEERGILEDFLSKDRNKNKVRAVSPKDPDGKYAKLSYRCLESCEGLTWMEVELETGRAHQIRVQFASRGCPIWGDMKYGSKHPQKNIALWSYRLAFIHPTRKEKMEFTFDVREYLSESSVWDIFDEGEKDFLNLK